MSPGPKRRPVFERLNEKTDTSGGPTSCWPYMGRRTSSGYGLLHVYDQDGHVRNVRAHRVAWEQASGRVIPDQMCVLHSCDNPPCCNPAHLRLGSLKDNTQDMLAKGRGVYRTGERHPRSVLTAASVSIMRKKYRGGNVTIKQLGVEFGVSTRTALFAVRGRTWKAVQPPGVPK